MSLSKKKKTEKMLKIAEAKMNIKVECKGQSRNEKFSVVTFQGVFMMIDVKHPMISETK